VLLAASLRPSFRVIGGLELAAEVARRSSAPDGGELNAFRVEAGWRFDDRFLVAVGFNAIGYSGIGIDVPTESPSGSKDRVYLRAEVAY